MKLYVTPGSPFAWLVQMVIGHKRLMDRISIHRARTRTVDSPYYQINPSGRVPFLVLDDGVTLEDSPLICAYLDALDGVPELGIRSPEWPLWRLEAHARSLLDGLCVWSRELDRSPDERSPRIIEHERQRAYRLVQSLAKEVETECMTGPLNMAQLTLFCALMMADRLPDFDWRQSNPPFENWYRRMLDYDAIADVESQVR